MAANWPPFGERWRTRKQDWQVNSPSPWDDLDDELSGNGLATGGQPVEDVSLIEFQYDGLDIRGFRGL